MVNVFHYIMLMHVVNAFYNTNVLIKLITIFQYDFVEGSVMYQVGVYTN